MVTERDSEFSPWPAEADPIRMAALPLIEVVMEMTAPDSSERQRAMDVVLQCVERIRAALHRPRLN
jgi:hypothetical protein